MRQVINRCPLHLLDNYYIGLHRPKRAYNKELFTFAMVLHYMKHNK